MENILSFFEDAPESFWVIDQNYKLIYANNAFFVACEKIFNKPTKLGDSVLEITPEETEPYYFWRSAYEKAFQFKKYTIERVRKNNSGGGRHKTRYDFRTVEAITKFLCIRTVNLSEVGVPINQNLLSQDSAEFTLSIDEDGNILRISPAVQNLLGYFTEWMENKSVIDFLHPDEKDILRSFFRSNESMEATWCRIRDVNEKYFWCNIQMAAFGQAELDRKYVISINEIRLQKTPADSYVPDANVLQVISESQKLYISTGSVNKAFETCLLFLQNEGITPFSFVAALDWKGTEPSLKIIAECGSWIQSNTDSVERLLKTLSIYCLEIQRGINNKVEQEIYNGFAVKYESTSFVMYLLIQNEEIIGVVCTSDFLATDSVPQVSPFISYFRPLFVSILQSSRFMHKANEAVRKLAVSTDELQSLVTSLDDIILEVNADFEIVNIWSNEKVRLTLPKELVAGKKIREAKGSVLGKQFEEAIKKVIDTEASSFIEYQFTLSNILTWFSAKMNLVKMFNGEKRVSILISDISKQKQVETAIAETLQKEKDLNEMKSKMITSVSHEFRTPLATIVSSTELLEMHIKKEYNRIDERAVEMFGNIYEEVERLSDMMRNFLVMGRFEENKMPFRSKETDIVATVQKIIRSRFQVKYGEEKIKLNIINNPKDVEIDQSLFWHIITNLVANAIKYSSYEDHVEVDLQFLEDEFVLKVKDFGIGIPPEDLPNIFQSFYRARNSDDHRGYGLGLSIVEKFVNMHQARIEVFSKVREGSTFIIHFKYHIHEKD
jgi:PAS domain S-box-containing protein